jgi:hypothetical protein
MLKSIKKSYNIFIVILAALVLSVTLLSLIVRIPAVQTFIVKKVTGYISGETKSTVSIGKVRFSFFNKLEFAEVLIKDQHNDTLLYAPEVVIGIRQLNRKNNSIRLGKVVVIKPVVGFITDSTGLMNLTWYLNLIQKPKASTPV